MNRPTPRPRIILASRSPRRRELLSEAGYDFEVCPPLDEAEPPPLPGESTRDYVARLATAKARDVARQLQGRPRDDSGQRCVVVGCDTVAECGGEVLGKPVDRADARRMLELLSGREHHVLSGLCVIEAGHERVEVDLTRLRMDRLAASDLDEYLASGQWEGKAGAFGYQDRLGWVHVVVGSESNVVGLPLELLARMLA